MGGILLVLLAFAFLGFWLGLNLRTPARIAVIVLSPALILLVVKVVQWTTSYPDEDEEQFAYTLAAYWIFSSLGVEIGTISGWIQANVRRRNLTR
jgi:hypothetical protein